MNIRRTQFNRLSPASFDRRVPGRHAIAGGGDLTFNLGVEAGQLLFVLAVLASKAFIDRLTVIKLPWARTIAGYGIGSMAAIWFVQRLALML